MRGLKAILALIAAAMPIAMLPAQPSPPVAATATGDYRLGVSDKLRITVFNEPTMSGEFPIGPGGTVAVPLVGDIAAVGATPTELARRIETKLADGYLKNPKVSVDVLTFRPFYILGEVGRSGEYPYSVGLTVMNAIATAQGFSYRANQKYVFLKHAGEATEKKVRLTPDLAVQPGDTIRIGERYF